MTEIFGTLGPACAQADILEKMFLEGMTGMRLNLSHTNLRESESLIQYFHQAAQRAGVRPELLIDMQGPEIRIGELCEPLQLKESKELTLTDQSAAKSDAGAIPVADSVLSVLEAGDHILLDDGKFELVVTSVKPQIAVCVLRGGILQEKKSLKVVDKQIPGPVLTEQDRENIRMAKDYGVTALMQPFVTKGTQLSEVKSVLWEHEMTDIRIFAKIENREGMRQMREIMPDADMICLCGSFLLPKKRSRTYAKKHRSRFWSLRNCWLRWCSIHILQGLRYRIFIMRLLTGPEPLWLQMKQRLVNIR